MKIVYNSDPVVRSLRRLVELSKLLKEYKDPIIYAGIKRESNILLRRTVKLWVTIRVGENWLPWRILNRINERKRKEAIEASQEFLEDLPVLHESSDEDDDEEYGAY